MDDASEFIALKTQIANLLFSSFPETPFGQKCRQNRYAGEQDADENTGEQQQGQRYIPSPEGKLKSDGSGVLQGKPNHQQTKSGNGRECEEVTFILGYLFQIRLRHNAEFYRACPSIQRIVPMRKVKPNCSANPAELGFHSPRSTTPSTPPITPPSTCPQCAEPGLTRLRTLSIFGKALKNRYISG